MLLAIATYKAHSLANQIDEPPDSLLAALCFTSLVISSVDQTEDGQSCVLGRWSAMTCLLVSKPANVAAVDNVSL